MTILCLASYEKGHEFLREAKRQGCARRPADLARASRTRPLAHGEHRRDLLHARPEPRVEPRGHHQGGELSGAHPRHRPHRGARRFRCRTGRRPARAPAPARHGRDHRPPFPRQARHAHEGARGRHQRPGFRPRAELRRAAPLHGKHARALGAQAALHGRRHRDQEDSPRATNCGPPSSRSATCSPSTCWSSLSRAISSTWIASFPKSRWCSPSPPATGVRRWKSRTAAASSPPEFWSARATMRCAWWRKISG